MHDAFSGLDLTPGGTSVPGNATGHVYSTAANFVRETESSVLQVTDTDLDPGNSDYAIASWFYLDEFAGAGQSAKLVSKSNGTFEFHIVQFDIDESTHTMGFTVFSDDFHAVDVTGLSLSTWHFLVAWHDSTNDLIWLQLDNGTPDSVASGGTLASGTNAWTIGGDAALDTTKTWGGRIGPMMYWKGRILSSDERSQLWNGGSGLTYASFSEGFASLTLKELRPRPFAPGIAR